MTVRSVVWFAVLTALPGPSPAAEDPIRSVTVPMTIDHNRMLVAAEIRGRDGGWHEALLWVDSGNPETILDESFTRKLGIEVPAPVPTGEGRPQAAEVPPLAGVRIGGLEVDHSGVKTSVLVGARVLRAMHADGNLPSTVMQRYHVVFDYPARTVTIAHPGIVQPRGTRVAAAVNRSTGIVQIDAAIGAERVSLALDNGASYSFVSADVLARFAAATPGWPRGDGAVGCANIWGLWPQEATWPLLRVPEMSWGEVPLADVGLVGLPSFFPGGTSLGAWYSKKTAHPVEGFLGPNAFKAYRVEIDYAGSAVYFEKTGEPDAHDMDLVGITLQPAPGGRWEVLGVSRRDGKPVVEGVEPGDVLFEVDGRPMTGVTMGTAVDALRGTPGEVRTLVLDRNGTRLTVPATVKRLL